MNDPPGVMAEMADDRFRPGGFSGRYVLLNERFGLPPHMAPTLESVLHCLTLMPLATVMIFSLRDSSYVRLVCTDGAQIDKVPFDYLQPIHDAGLMPSHVTRLLAAQGYIEN